MYSIPWHIGPRTPTSLSGAGSGTVTLTTGVRRVRVQADLLSSSTALLYFRTETATGGTATALDSADHVLTHRGAIEFDIPMNVTPLLMWYLTDATGNAATGGANDYLRIAESVL